MDKTEKFDQWLDIAKYDLGTAEAMRKTARWLYVVFMCQQAIEKLAKGLYILYVDDNIPKIHNIRQIINKYANQLSEEVSTDYYDLFDRLTSFYLEGRYPEELMQPSKIINKKGAEDLHRQTKEAFKWLLTMKP